MLVSLGCSRPLIVTDKMMVKLGYARTVQEALAAASIVSDVFDDTVPEPTDASIIAGVEKVRHGSSIALDSPCGTWVSCGATAPNAALARSSSDGSRACAGNGWSPNRSSCG